jgi:excisionase family DNA binding protein
MSSTFTDLAERERRKPTHAKESFGRLVSPKAACERLNCSIPTIYGLIRSGELESFKIGKYRKILERSIDALIARGIAA